MYDITTKVQFFVYYFGRAFSSVLKISMPPKTKRQRLSAEAAAVGREKLKERRLSYLGLDETSGAGGASTEVATIARDPQEIILSQFSEEWLMVLDRDDKKSPALLLCCNLMSYFELNTHAAGIAAQMAKKVQQNCQTVAYRSD